MSTVLRNKLRLLNFKWLFFVQMCKCTIDESYLGDCHSHAGEPTFLFKCARLNAAAASLFSLNMQFSQLRFGGK